jgi:hypothetical protein
LSEFDIFLAYWQSLPRKAGCSIPGKSAFNPADIKEFLPFIMIHESLGRFSASSQLVGTAIDELIGKSYTGVNLYDLYAKEDHELFARMHGNLLQVPCGARSQHCVLLADGRHLSIPCIHLPLANDAGTPIYLLTLIGPPGGHAPGDATPGEGGIITMEKTVEYLDLGCGLPDND